MNNPRSGFALPAIVAIIAVILAGTGYLVTTQSDLFGSSREATDTATSTAKNTVPQDETTLPRASDHIEVTAPKNGDALVPGSAYAIRWTNYTGNEPLTIALRATRPDGSVSSKIIAENIPASREGIHTWTVTAEDPASTYKVEIYPEGGREMLGRSEGYFTVSAPTERYDVYTVYPGFVTPEAYAQFEKTKKVCVGRSEPIPGDSRIADGPSFAKCFGYLTPASSAEKPPCVRGGCSGQLCIEQPTDGNGPVTTCEYRAQYACYQTAVCERQTNGSCGWTETTSLRSCLANPPSIQ